MTKYSECQPNAESQDHFELAYGPENERAGDVTATERMRQIVTFILMKLKIGETMQFALVQNDGMINSQCGVCGQNTDPLPFDVIVFGDGGPAPVCGTCREQYALELMYIRSMIPKDLIPQQHHKPDKQSLLDHYAGGSVQQFIQYDGHHVGVGGDDVLDPDEDGDVYLAGETWELRRSRSTLAVRVFVHSDPQCADVVRIMRKLSDSMVWNFSGTDEFGNLADPLESTTAMEAWESKMRRN